jgi:hypothetical protein
LTVLILLEHSYTERLILLRFCIIQAISTISHISFAEEESVSPKKPTSIAEVAKQRELSGTLLSEDDSKMKRQISDLKSKELSGHDIFAPPEDPRPRNSENGSTSQTPGKNAYVLISQPNFLNIHTQR